MRPLLLNTSDGGGGAARAAARLHMALRAENIESAMLVQWKSGDLPDVFAPQGLVARAFSRIKFESEKFRLRGYQPVSKDFSAPSLPSLTPGRVRRKNPDLVHLHWTSYGLLNIEDLPRLHVPIVWTLHDMWAFTGGCHYSLGCSRYRQQCGHCPVLSSSDDNDLSRHLWQRKQRAWKDLDLHIVTPSRWMAEAARNSSLFAGRNIQVIPNTLDVTCFKPGDRSAARARFDLPQEPRLVLFGAVNGANNPRKGPHLLRAALEYLRDHIREPVELVVLGQSGPSPGNGFALPTHYAGSLSDDVALADLYAASDVVVLPSVEDNLPNIAMEALACGRPCVGFDIGGLPDLIEHGRSGYLARPQDPADFAQGILQCLDKDRSAAYGEQAHAHAVAHYAPHVIAQQHIALYRKALAQLPARA
jgi:glycosyltransferase involved in cell wall biosynthesis